MKHSLVNVSVSFVYITHLKQPVSLQSCFPVKYEETIIIIIKNNKNKSAQGPVGGPELTLGGLLSNVKKGPLWMKTVPCGHNDLLETPLWGSM